VNRGRHRRGQTLVEFALVLPLFVLILVGLFDVGRAVFYTSTLNNAAREASRWGVTDQTPAHIQAVAEQHAVALNVDGTDPSQVEVLFFEADGTTPCASLGAVAAAFNCIVQVRVMYDYSPAVPLIGNIVGDITLSGESSFRIENSCHEPDQPSCPLGD
jgi:Flp pilus assembly protein TadG